MKRQLILLGLLSASALPISGEIMPAYAANRIEIFNEIEGRVKDIGSLRNNTNYTLRGDLDTRRSDTRDEFSFRVTTTGNYSFVYNLVGCQSGERIAFMTLSNLQTGRSFGTTSVCRSVFHRLDPGIYMLRFSGQPRRLERYQAHIITPR